jgi:hypothetical protein
MTTEFVCPRCGDVFNRKDTLLTHLKKKKECPTTYSTMSREDISKGLTTKTYNEKTYDCDFCGKKFNFASCKCKHKKICKSNPINIIKREKDNEDANGNDNVNSDNTTVIDNDDTENANMDIVVSGDQRFDITSASPSTMDNTKKYVVIDKDEFVLMKSRMNKLENEVKKLKSHKPSTTTNTIITNNNNINITLNSFGQETLTHLTHDFLSHCLLNPSKGFTSLIENIHYNNDVPENRNIRCKSLKRNVFEKYIDSEWRSCDASNTLDELIRKGYRILNTHYTQHFMNDPELMEDELRQRAYERFRFLCDKTCNDYFSVKRDIRLLVKDKTMYLIAPPDAEQSNDNNDETEDIESDN